jgi:transposase
MSEHTLMMEHDPSITDDPAVLRAQLDAAKARIRDLELQVDETCATTEELERALACLKEQYLALKRMMFGPRRERLPDDPNQQLLFDQNAQPSAPPEADDPTPARSRKRRKGHGRRPIPENLPRERIVHEVDAKDCVCDCGRDKAKIGEDVTERLEYKPGKLFVEQHVYPKYACSCCKDGVTAADRVPSPIPGGLAGPGLAAHVLVNKFAVHIPFYRQQDELSRAGIFLARSTLCGWIGHCAERLRPLVDLMRQRIRQSDVIQADETPVPVLDPKLDTTRTGYLWTYLSPDRHPYTIFDYRDSRSREGPTEILKDYRGYLVTDAYAAYESVVAASNGRIIAVGCWAHARRDFFDARTNQPREVHYVLSLIRQLYDIEDQEREASPEQRLAARQEHSVPILDRLEQFLKEQAPDALPKSKYGQAIGYVLNQHDALRRFTEDGRLPIDNNFSEGTIRVAAIGRKNWLFFGSDRGGETAAICLSILASAKRHLIEPFAYVRDLLIALSVDGADLEPLLPDNWIKAHPEHFLAYRRDEANAAAKARARRRLDRREKRMLSGEPPLHPPDDG